MGPLVFALNPNLGPGFSSRQLPQTTGGMSVQQPNRYASGLEHLLYQPGFAARTALPDRSAVEVLA